jgi:hypothetical protein
MKLRLSDWASIAEILAALAVVISLGVVAFELNQNTAQARLETTALQNGTYQELVTNVIDLNTLIVQDAEFADLMNRAETASSELSEAEIRRLSSFWISVFRHGDMAYFLYTQGTINQERLDSLLSIVVTRIDGNTPTASQIWEQFGQAGILNAEYVAYVEGLRDRSDYSGSINRVFREQ